MDIIVHVTCLTVDFLLFLSEYSTEAKSSASCHQIFGKHYVTMFMQYFTLQKKIILRSHMKIAIHGGMAVGKTTLLKEIEKNFPDLTYSYEAISPVIKKVKLLGLNKNEYCDYLINQDLFIKHEIRRFKSFESQTVLLDYSAEEVVFQTLNFPKVFHPEWKMHHIENTS